jgi:hypothetical protein
MVIEKSPIEIEVLADGRMDAENASTYTGLSRQTLANYRSRGNGPKFVKCGRIFYYKDDLDEWLRAGRVSSTAELRKPKPIDCSS